MTDPDHTHLRRLFEAALALPPAQRTVFLDKKCANDPALAQRLRAMLAAAAGADAPTDAPAPDRSMAAAETLAPPQELPGGTIGPYKLLQQIGEGGFGVVFLAEQEQPVRRRVALKVIKVGMDTRQVVARFEQERQALAMMDHPHIARVLDAGATDAGRPYFVMELCKGEPIVDYCDRNSLTIEERLQLMEQVCHAVQHAHGKGIIHRDLKPSNILVGTQDGGPQAKVIDFGIAKATSQRLTDKTLFTEHRQIIGTLQYMSPEQAEGSLDIDTRTDVYSLGVLLYELLTGSTPFDIATLGGGYLEAQRMIREVEPRKPSTRLSDLRDQLANIAAHRRIEARRLGSLVRGELDWIVMKALEKDRSRRYETVNGLAMDLRRYLTGEAVVAAPPSAGYRLRKLVRRHRGVVAAVAGIAAALLIGLVGFAWQARVAQRERDDALQARQAEAEARAEADRLAAAEGRQRRLAEDNEHKAAAISQFLVSMLGSANIRARGREARVSQALDDAAGAVGTTFADQPDIEVAVRRILGSTYLSLGLLDEAKPHLDRTIELDRRLQGEQSADFSRSLEALAVWKQMKGDDAGAIGDFERAIRTAREISGPEDSRTLAAQVQYANSLHHLGRDREAEALLRTSLDALTRTLGREAQQTQIAINSLAVLVHGLGRLEEAEALYREAVELGESTQGADDPDTLTARANLASVMQSRGEFAAARELMTTTFASMQRVFGDSHPKTGRLARTLAQLLADQGRYRDAVPLYEQSLASCRHIEGDRSAAVAMLLDALAMALSKSGEPGRAVTLLQEATELLRSLSGPEHPDTLRVQVDLANTLVADRQFAAAEALFRDLLRNLPRVLGEDHATTIIATNSQAVLLMSQERFADAAPYLEQALAIGRRVQGEDHPNTLVTELNRATALREIGRLDEAAALGADAIERFERVFGAQHPYSAVAHRSHAETLAALGRNGEAEGHLRTAIDIAKAAAAAEHPTFAASALLLARLLVDDGRPEAAEPVLHDVLRAYSRPGDAQRVAANAHIELARCRWRQQHFADAEPLLLEGLPVLEALLPKTLGEVQRAERYLGEFYAAWNAAEPDPGRAARAAEWQAKAAARR